MFLFELKKIWRQKKFLWLLLISLLCTFAIYQSNTSEQKGMKERAFEQMEAVQNGVSSIHRELSEIERKQELTEIQQNQRNVILTMNLSLLQWNRAIDNEEWENIYPLKLTFLELVEQYEEYGETFFPLSGQALLMEKEMTKWFIEHELIYEDEEFPISPHLLVKGVSTLAFSVFGLFLLLLFFGNSITSEKEQNTWLTIQTQPISRITYLASKYSSLVVVTIVFMLLFVLFGVSISSVFSDYTLSLHYPQLVKEGEAFMIVSTFTYMIRMMVLFICAAMMMFAIVTFVSSFMKNTFMTIMLTTFIIMIGFSLTEINNFLQVIENPFQFFRLAALTETIPQSTDWLHPLIAIMWSLFFVTIAYFVPEKQGSLFQRTSNLQPFKDKKINRNPLLYVIVFEWRKVVRKRLFLQINILLLLFVTIGYFMLFQQSSKQEVEYLEKLQDRTHIENMIASAIELKSTYQEIKEKTGESIYDTFLLEIDKTLEFFDEKWEKGNEAISAYQHGDWLPFHLFQLFENQTAFGEIDTGAHYPDLRMERIGKFTVEVSMAEKEWLMTNNIQPIFTGEFRPTIHHSFTTVEEQAVFEKENRKLDSSGLFSLYLFTEYYLYLIPILLFLFLFGGGLAFERGKKPTIQLMKTQPISASNLYFSKLFLGITLSIVSCLALFLVIILTGSIFNRFGDWAYPIIHYNHDSIVASTNYSGMISNGFGYHFLPLGEYLIYSIVIFVLCITFILTITMFLSTFIKNTLTVFVMSTLFHISGYYLTEKFTTDYAHLSPFTYFQFTKVINGELSIVVDNANINFLYGSIVLTGLTLLFMIFGYLVLRNNNRKSKSLNHENHVAKYEEKA